MKNSFLEDLSENKHPKKPFLAVLIDPDKFRVDAAEEFLRKISFSTTHIFVGGSTVEAGHTEACIKAIKAETDLSIVIFPGDHQQISEAADALLFLSLISGRNPEYLIGQQVKAAGRLRSSALEIIPTGYILVDGGKRSAVEKLSQTQPLPQDDVEKIVNTALAGKFLGQKLIYLEAGSGAENPVRPEIISAVKTATQLPLIVGGGIRSEEGVGVAHRAGADLVVVGTAFETGNFFSAKKDKSAQLSRIIPEKNIFPC